MRLEDHIQDIPDFPKPGIVFKDITPLFLDAEALALHGRPARRHARASGRSTTWSRRRRAASCSARRWPSRPAPASSSPASPGKLPREVSSVEYALEYGVDALEVHSDAIRDGARVLVHDDLLATGGTAGALCKLVEQAGGVVAGCAFVIELAFLHGREQLAGVRRALARRGRRRVMVVRRERVVPAAARRGVGHRERPHQARGVVARRVARRGGEPRGVDHGARVEDRQVACGPTTPSSEAEEPARVRVAARGRGVALRAAPARVHHRDRAGAGRSRRHAGAA